MNRTLIVILIVALLIVGAAVAYFILRPTTPGQRPIFPNLPIIGGRAPLPAAPPPVPVGPPSGPQPTARLREIIAEDILAPTASADGKSLYYLERGTGHIMQSDLDGNGRKSLTALTLLEAFDGLWSPLKNRIVISYPENGLIKRFVQSTATATPSYFLPARTLSASWSPDGKNIAYLVRQGERTNLVIADQQNRGAAAVYQTPVPDLTLAWIGRSTILLVSRPSGLAPSLLITFDTASRRAEPILAGASGVVILPLPDGFIFSQSSNRGEAQPISRYAFRDAAVAALGATTIAEKCAAAKDGAKIYCGVPTGAVSAPSPDEWYKGAVSFADNIVEIDLASGGVKPLTSGEANVDTLAPFLSSDGQYLFFQDKGTGHLWRLTLGE